MVAMDGVIELVRADDGVLIADRGDVMFLRGAAEVAFPAVVFPRLDNASGAGVAQPAFLAMGLPVVHGRSAARPADQRHQTRQGERAIAPPGPQSDARDPQAVICGQFYPALPDAQIYAGGRAGIEPRHSFLSAAPYSGADGECPAREALGLPSCAAMAP